MYGGVCPLLTLLPPPLLLISFPNGESGLDVYTRVTSFISTMFRDFADGHICRPSLNVVIVTHGLTLRLVRLFPSTHPSCYILSLSSHPLTNSS